MAESAKLQQPAKELADSAVIFAVGPGRIQAIIGVYFDITEKVKIELDKASVGIPYPQMNVCLHRLAG